MTPEPLTELAPAKVNLTLRVGAPRPDGYHPLDSLVVFADWGDTVEVRPGPGLLLTLSGEASRSLPPDGNNLVLQAARSLQAAADIDDGAMIRLDKQIPVEAGLGGGYLLAERGPRLSVGAVALSSGNFAYFDSARERIEPEHVIASGALPPGFPPVAIGEELYWDGGLVSNTPLQYVLEWSGPRRDMCVFQVDLFSAEGPRPKTLLEVALREKAIRYSSRTRLNTRSFKELQTLRRAARRLLEQLPPELQDSEDAKRLADWSCDAAVTIVHLINRPESYTRHSMDYEFSRLSMQEHWRDGEEDVRRTLAHPDFRNRTRPPEGVAVFDLTRKSS